MELTTIAAGIAIGIGTIGAGLGIGMIGKAWLEALSRNPDLKNEYQTSAILAIAFAEGTAIFSLVVALILIFVK